MAKLQRRGVLAGTFGQPEQQAGGVAVADAPEEAGTAAGGSDAMPAEPEVAPPAEPAAETVETVVPAQSVPEREVLPVDTAEATASSASVEPDGDGTNAVEETGGSTSERASVSAGSDYAALTEPGPQSGEAAGVAISAPDGDAATAGAVGDLAEGGEESSAEDAGAPKKAAIAKKAAPRKATAAKPAPALKVVAGDPAKAREAVNRSWMSAKRQPQNWTAVGVRLSDHVKTRLEQRRAQDVGATGVPFAETHYTNVALAMIPEDLDEADKWVEEYLDSLGMTVPQSTGTTSRCEKATRAHMDKVAVQMRAQRRFGLIGALQSAAMTRLLNLLDAADDNG